MKSTEKKQIAVAILVLLAVVGLGAQARSKSSSVSVQIVAVVPTVLGLSLDFSSGSSTLIQGYLPSSEDSAGGAGSFDTGRFLIRENKEVELGNARLFSNTKGFYSIEVYSANGGSLQSETGAEAAALPYTLTLGGMTARNRDGAFSFRTSGKTTGEGTTMKVALAFAAVPASAVAGRYYDNLMFSVSAD